MEVSALRLNISSEGGCCALTRLGADPVGLKSSGGSQAAGQAAVRMAAFQES